MKSDSPIFEISPKTSLLAFNFKEIWQYRDLLVLFVRRDFVAMYKQTILGPLWFFIQPIISSFVFYIIFNRVANIPTDGMPPYLFYLAGLTAWNYFSTCLNSTSNVFVGNAGIFGKVYFPRLITPLSIVISNLIKFAMQFVVFMMFYVYFYFQGAHIQFTMYAWLFPILLVLMGGLGLAMGIIVSALTTKYRDLTFLVGFGVQLFMYATPVIYPLSQIPEKYHVYIMLNPMTGVIETFRLAFLGVGIMNWTALWYSMATMIVLLFIGIILFNKTEKNFMDTV
ncbi:MAG TPA: ABC transporter permease [Bacteroidales bacterium]|jgi:lipopolysaccharide transport system permease protein|nr:ABC transporter permease [Bacteroidales bacterium]HRS19133.1 ABC transporter permease [Bacteroidales bacterium]